MAMLKKGATLMCTLLVLGSGAAYAQDVEKAVKARQSLMTLYSHYLGSLGAMAKGDAEYDAETAGSIAASLSALAALDQSSMWPQGSDSDSLGEASAALPAIWSTFPAIVEKSEAMTAAAQNMAAAAGSDLASLQAAMGPLGGACSSCHKEYRLKRD